MLNIYIYKSDINLIPKNISIQIIIHVHAVHIPIFLLHIFLSRTPLYYDHKEHKPPSRNHPNTKHLNSMICVVRPSFDPFPFEIHIHTKEQCAHFHLPSSFTICNSNTCLGLHMLNGNDICLYIFYKFIY